MIILHNGVQLDGIGLVEIPVKRRIVEAVIYHYSEDDGDRYDDLTDGYYLIFDEDDLYSTKLSRTGKQFRKQFGKLPEFKNWTSFG